MTDHEYIGRARELYHRDGEIEIDESAVVSRGGEPGAYVQAWVWVEDPVGRRARRRAPKTKTSERMQGERQVKS